MEEIYQRVYFDTDEDLLKRTLTEEDDAQTAALSIREEIMDNVMEQCRISYMEKQTIRFIVQCAYDALVKYLTFNFYYHPEVPDVMEPSWIADESVGPSPKDTWARGAVPVRPINYKVEPDDFGSDIDLFSYKSSTDKERSDSKVCMCLGHVCTCQLSAGDLRRMPIPVQSSKIKCSPRSSKGSLTRDNLAIIADFGTSLTSVSSIGLATAKEEGEKLARVQSKLSRSTLKVEKKTTKSVKKVDLESVVPLRGSKASIVDLAPIRVCSTFNSKPAGKEKKKKW